MHTIINIFVHPKVLFKELSDEFEHKLNMKVNLLLILAGLVMGAKSFFKEASTELFVADIQMFFIVLTAILNLLLGKYILAPVLYGIGKLLKAKGELIDMRVVVAIAQVPIILSLPMILYLGFSGAYAQLGGIKLWIVNAVNVSITLLTINILIQGLCMYNQYGIGKAVLNLIPYWLILITSGIYVLQAFLQ